MSTGTYHVTVGAFECVAVGDGTFTYPASMLFVNAAPDQLRRALFAHAAAEQQLVLGCHFPFPGLGYVDQQRTRWQWRPLHLTSQDTELARRSP